MKNLRIYLSGKITGDADYVMKFIHAQNELNNAGYLHIVNPIHLASARDEWNAAMRRALAGMLSCDGVALLPDWRESRGAKIEERLAREIGLVVKPLEDWIKGAE
jgi:hypothetical protein